jgi:ribokinase
MQLEIPIDTVKFVAQAAKSKGVKVILNPAPAAELSDDLLRNISIITPNEKEAEMLTGKKVTDVESAKEAAQMLQAKGISTVIITLGQKGALLYHDNTFELVPSLIVKAVDTTAAGDVFSGALAVALTEGKLLKEATAWACRAAAISVTRKGAQASAPFKKELS